MTLFRTLLLSSLVALTACGDSSAPATPAAAPEAVKETTYVCPMHPEVTSTDASTKCSKCGMDLVEKDAPADHSDHAH